MLVRLTPDQVSKYWDVLKYAIVQSIPEGVDGSPDKINTIFESLLIGRMVCWASVILLPEQDKTIIEGILITSVNADRVTGTKNLSVFCVYAFAEESQDLSWGVALEKLKDYARAKGCAHVVGFAKDREVIEFAAANGASVETRFIVFPVSENDE